MSMILLSAKYINLIRFVAILVEMKSKLNHILITSFLHHWKLHHLQDASHDSRFCWLDLAEGCMSMLSMIDFFPYLTIFEHPIIVGSFSYGLFVLLSEVAFSKIKVVHDVSRFPGPRRE